MGKCIPGTSKDNVFVIILTVKSAKLISISEQAASKQTAMATNSQFFTCVIVVCFSISYIFKQRKFVIFSGYLV